MRLSSILALFPYFLSFSLSVGVALYTYRYRRSRAAEVYTAVALGQAFTTFAFIVEIVTPTLPEKQFWDNLQWVSFAFVPVLILFFGLMHIGTRFKHPLLVLLVLCIVPTVFSGFVFTNDFHELVGTNYRVVEGEPFSTLLYDFGPVAFISMLYSYAIMFTWTAIMVQFALRQRGIYRAQALTIVIGWLVPVIASFLPIQIFGQRDISPFTFGIGNVVVAFALFRFRLFDAVPVARDYVIENMPDPVIVLDVEDRVVDLNPAAAEVAETNRAEAIGKPVDQVFHAWPELAKQYRNVLTAQAQLKIQYRGAETYIQVNISPIYRSATKKHLIGRVIVVRDVTERVMYEAQLNQRNAEMAAARAEAEAARTRAEAADRIKSQFLASMSHELRTPLNAILNFTEFVANGMMGEVNERQVDALHKVTESGKYLLSLINDVLDMTKIQAGMLTLLIEEGINLNAELLTVLNAVRALIKDKDLKLIEDIDSDLPRISGDRRRIKQILLNLLSNAVKFTEEGTITLSAKGRGDHVLFAVIDTGPGIAKEEQEMIFEPFRQTRKGMGSQSGTGLGLPISRSFARAHGGDLWLESEPGEGAAFYVRLPIVLPENLPTITTNLSHPVEVRPATTMPRL